MGILVYDAVNNAYKDASSLKKYEQSNGAWTDCTSAQVQENGVWVEKLKQPLFLIQNGKMQVDFSICGLRQVNNSYHGFPTGANITTQSNGVYFSIGGSTGTGAGAGVCTKDSYDLSKYNKICMNVVNAFGKGSCSKGGVLTKGSPTSNNSAGTWRVSVTSFDEVPYLGDYKGYLYYDGCSDVTNFYTECGIEDVIGTYPIVLATWNTYVFPSYVTIKDAWLE